MRQKLNDLTLKLTTMNKLTASAFVICSMFLVFACNQKSEKAQDAMVYATDAQMSCNCEADWFPHATTPAPMEGIGSPFDTSSTTNCIFHQWSWQKFLWLTRPTASGRPFFQDSMIQIDAMLEPVAPYKGTSLVLSDTAQAGSGAFLQTNAAYGSGQQSATVYYSIFANNTLIDASAGFKASILKDTALLNNLETFPVNALELKVSWVNTAALPANQLANYYTTVAAISAGNVITIDTVAMLGMHVVGRVINHPEFIWATFEHQQMAPSYNWSTTTDSLDSPITSADDLLLFAKGSTTTLGGITAVNHLAVIPNKVYSLYKYGVPQTVNGAFLPGTSQSEPLNYQNVDDLNKCVSANLPNDDVWKNYFYNGSIWVNTDGLTDLQQAQLIVDQANNIGVADSGAVARGSLNVYNLTMETFVQTGAKNEPNTIHSIGVGNLLNCFTCHTGSPFQVNVNGNNYSGLKSPLYVSHIFRNYLGATEGVAIEDAKRQGIVDFIAAKSYHQIK